jgi:hypothetical protein
MDDKIKILCNDGCHRWEYGFGVCGLGAYLLFFDKYILFIPDND